jgi:hypothetical protein
MAWRVECPLKTKNENDDAEPREGIMPTHPVIFNFSNLSVFLRAL